MTEAQTTNAAQQAPVAAVRGYHLLPGESPDILADVADVVPNHEAWLDAPNAIFAGDTPRSLVGTDREIRLRDVLRAIKYGLYS